MAEIDDTGTRRDQKGTREMNNSGEINGINLKWMTFNTNDSPLLTHRVFLVISVVKETTIWILAAGDLHWSVICVKKEGHKQKHCPEYDSIPVNNYY